MLDHSLPWPLRQQAVAADSGKYSTRTTLTAMSSHPQVPPFFEQIAEHTGAAEPVPQQPQRRRVQPQQGPPAMPLRELSAQVAAVVTSIVGRPLEADAPLMASGLDSLASVELQNVLQARFALPLSATLAMDYPTIGAIAGHIHSRLAPPPMADVLEVPRRVSARAAGMDSAAAVVGKRGWAAAVRGIAVQLPGGMSDGSVMSMTAVDKGLDTIVPVPYER